MLTVVDYSTDVFSRRELGVCKRTLMRQLAGGGVHCRRWHPASGVEYWETAQRWHDPDHRQAHRWEWTPFGIVIDSKVADKATARAVVVDYIDGPVDLMFLPDGWILVRPRDPDAVEMEEPWPIS